MIALVLGLALGAPSYAVEKFEGWTVHRDSALQRAENRKAWDEARQELRSQLWQIGRAVPAGPLAELRKVPIWVHNKGPWTQCMAYHPSREWLRDNGLNPAMANGIEIGNVRTFSAWTRQQPWMVLHELAHAYHDRVLEKGFENADVAAAFRGAMADKRYEQVLHWNGDKVKHYACTNPMEYFAEASEAFLGTNDFYPFVRSELRIHDPEGYVLMKRIWSGEP
jgi:hypothetical protein